MIQQYLNPFYRPQALGATYGLCSWTHLSEKAGKIQNTALRVVALAFAALFDATLGFGIVGTVAYNSGALLYNAGSKVKHLYQKYRGIEESSWNKTALKTWGLIGSLSLFGVLSYYGVKHWNFSFFPGVANNDQSLWRRWLPYVMGFAGIGIVGIAYDAISHRSERQFYRFKGQDYSPECWKVLSEILTELNGNQSLSKCEEEWVNHFSDKKIPILYCLVDRHLKEKDRARDLDDADNARDRWFRTNYALSCSVLEDCENYQAGAKFSAIDVFANCESRVLKICMENLVNYEKTRAHFTNNADKFYSENNPENLWRTLHNDLVERLLRHKEVDTLKAENPIFNRLLSVDVKEAYEPWTNDNQAAFDHFFKKTS